MGQLGTVVRMVVQRALGHWRLLLMMVAGVVLSAGMMASVFIYSDAIRDLGLKYALRQPDATDLDLRVLSSSGKITPTDYNYRRNTTDALLRGQAGAITTGIVHWGRSATFFATSPDAPVPAAQDRPRANFQFVDGLEQKAKLVAGKLPTPGMKQEEGKPPVVEVLVTKPVADAHKLNIGDSLDLHPHWRPQPTPVRIVITGIVSQDDPSDRAWGGQPDRFFLETKGWPTYLFFIDEKTYVEGIGSYLVDMDGSYETIAFVDCQRINSDNARETEDRINGLSQALRTQIPYTSLHTVLPDTVSLYREKLFFTRLPLFALMLQIVGIVLFYLVTVAGMVVERQTGEIALLKSRGASTLQVLTVFAIEAALVAGFATLTGPFLAAAAIKLLGLTPPFHDLSDGHMLAVRFSLGAVGMSALGSLLAFAAIVWPAYRACRFSITHYKQQISRPPRQPAFLRYYLDLVLIAAGAFAFYQLRSRGSLVTEELFGGLSSDPILLATPSLFILMVALIFLRLFPVALRIAVWLSKSLPGPTISLGLTRMVRSPLQHSRLILLLILTTAVGVFAAGFRATLERGYVDRASYQAAAVARLEDIRKPASVSTDAFTAALKEGTGSPSVMPALKSDGFWAGGGFHTENITLFAVRPDDFVAQGYWRSDFAGSSIGLGPMERLKQPAPEGAPKMPVVPAGARFLGVWVYSTSPTVFQPGIRLLDKDGLGWEYPLATEGPPTPGKWQFFTTDLSRRYPIRQATAQEAMASDRTFNSLYVRMVDPPQVPEPVTMLFDDLQVSSQDKLTAGWSTAGFADGKVIESFDDLATYEQITGVSETLNAGAVSRADAPAPHTGSAARLAFARSRTGAPLVGLRTVTDRRPLPVIASHEFLDVTKKKTGDELKVYLNNQYVQVKVVGTFELFPGYDPKESRPLLVAGFDEARAALSAVPSQADTATANAALLGARGTTEMTKDGLLGKGLQVERIYDLDELLAEQQSDPLVAASWEGILFMSFGAVLLLSALGFVTYASLSAQARSLEFAILRTMGFSGRQIIGVVSFEQFFVIIAGVAAGTLLGFPLSRLMIDYMDTTEAGTKPLPPLLSQVSWNAVVTVYVLLGTVVVATVAALVLLYSRLAVSRALRMGEL